MLSVQGKLVKHLLLQTGTSKAGKPWQKAGIVVEYGDEYPKLVALDLYGERATLANSIPDGTMVTVNFSVESNEYNGKYITNCRAFSIAPAQMPNQPSRTQQPQIQNPAGAPF